ncbi:MAG TPA: lysophospholipid acyltransferase family protein [Myxococcales bacterium]|nr:lysophospholipid acyltransferase family protein [Myxococcales bacterium]
MSRPLVTPGGPLATWLAGLAVALLRALPRSLVLAVARGAGRLALALGIRRAVTLDNLARAFPEKSEHERRSIARGAIRGAVRALRQGAAVAMLVDQVLPAPSAVFVPFFGRLAATSPALSAAAMRSGAPVFAVSATRDGAALRVLIEGPIPVPDTGDRHADMVAHTAAVTAAIERFIRRAPDQWLWLHRRWKVPPPPPQESHIVRA